MTDTYIGDGLTLPLLHRREGKIIKKKTSGYNMYNDTITPWNFTARRIVISDGV